MKTKASQVSADLRARLEEICQDNGYFSNLQNIYGPFDRVDDRAPLPYVLVRVVSDIRTSSAGVQATRSRTFEIEGVFGKSSEEEDLDAFHVDVLRALGFEKYQPERKFPGLIDEEDEAVPSYASQGNNTHSMTITVGVVYAETYN
jgi:hypothetical protein